MGCVLVIDDDAAFRQMACLMVTRLGFETQEMDGGRRILEGAAIDGVDIVLTDIFMPDGEGMETIRALRRLRPDLRVVAMSGTIDRRDGKSWLEMAEAMGAAASLKKPFNSPDLAEALGAS